MHSHAQNISNGFIQLLVAAKAGYLNEVMRLVLQEGVKPDDTSACDRFIFDGFYWLDFFDVLSNNHQRHQILLFLIQHGALNNYHNLMHLKTHIPITDEALTYPGTKNLLHTIINVSFSHNPTTLPLALKRLATTCATVLNEQTILANVVALPCYEETSFIEQTRLTVLKTTSATEAICQKQLESLSNSQEFSQIFSSIALLLQNTKLCLNLLEELESQLTATLSARDINLSSYLSTEHYLFNNHPWPLPSQDANNAKTYGVLNKLLLSKERQHGLNKANDAPITFAEFIEEDVATSYISAGYLFNDATHAGNRLHGKYSHRLQWYIILRAIELGYLDTKGHSVLTLLRQSTTVWLYLLDGYQAQSDQPLPIDIGFCSPYYLHSTLLLTPPCLPNLSALLRKIFFHSMPTDLPTFIQFCAEQDMRKIATQETSVEEYYQKKGQQQQITMLYQGKNNSAIFFKQSSPPNATKKSKQNPLDHRSTTMMALGSAVA